MSVVTKWSFHYKNSSLLHLNLYIKKLFLLATIKSSGISHREAPALTIQDDLAKYGETNMTFVLLIEIHVCKVCWNDATRFCCVKNCYLLMLAVYAEMKL